MSRHPAEELGRRGDRTDLGSRLRGAPMPLGSEAGEDVPDRGRRDERPDEMSAAALVLARRTLPVLVAADRDVLRAVVRGELAATQRKHRRRDRGDSGQQLPCDRPYPGFTEDADEGRGPEHRGERGPRGGGEGGGGFGAAVPRRGVSP